jgi:hypothetical protein
VRSGLSELKRPTADTTFLSQGLVLTFRISRARYCELGVAADVLAVGDNVAPQNFGGLGDARSCTCPHEVVADLRAEPSADRERKVQAVDLTT